MNIFRHERRWLPVRPAEVHELLDTLELDVVRIRQMQEELLLAEASLPAGALIEAVHLP